MINSAMAVKPVRERGRTVKTTVEELLPAGRQQNPPHQWKQLLHNTSTVNRSGNHDIAIIATTGVPNTTHW